jgi:hypothetical protein
MKKPRRTYWAQYVALMMMTAYKNLFVIPDRERSLRKCGHRSEKNTKMVITEI